MDVRRLAEPALRMLFDLYRSMRPRLAATKDALRRRARSNDLLRRVYYDPHERDVYAVRNERLFSDAWHQERMLADAVRVDAYERALSVALRPGAVVADIGTGCGILALLAARHGAGTVHAVDHAAVIEWARQVADARGEDRIRFHRTHSRDFDPGHRVDVLVHEQIGDWLFDERMLDTLLDLRDRILEPEGRILPGAFDLHIEPVQLVDEQSVPFLHQIEAAGIDFSVLRDVSDDAVRTLRLVVPPADVAMALSSPRPLLHVDLHELSEARLPTRLTATRTVERVGRFDGFCVSFVAHLTPEIRIDTSPFAPASQRPWHWANGFLRVETRDVRPGDRIELELNALDLARPETWTWNANVVEQTATQRAG